jgi:hypothetical protein
LIVVGVAMVVAASSGAATAKLSPRVAFEAKVRAIGLQAQNAMLAMPAESTPPTAAEQAAAARQLEAIYRRVAQRMGALKPPKVIQRDYRILAASYQAAAKNAHAWSEALANGTPAQAAAASSKLYLDESHYRAVDAIFRLGRHGYYFGTFFR